MNTEYGKYLSIFEKYLEKSVPHLIETAPDILAEAIVYSISGGGKRVRPVLCLAAADMLGIPTDSVLNFALAIELIHSYSLVHDDLPAMDNDDYRRGKLSTHKKFGEANGILAGDALLNLAVEVCLSKPELTRNELKAVKIIFDFAGAKGMIAGQVLDLANEKKQALCSEDDLYKVYINKTSKLITAPLLVASAMADNRYFDELEEFGENLGILFQITDDIMDEEGSLDAIGKTPHKDKEADKLTSIKLFGLSGAKQIAKEHYLKCKKIICDIPGSNFLSDFTDAMYLRKK